MDGDNWLQRIWYSGSRWYVVLLPLSWIFALLVRIRRVLYRAGVLSSHSAGVPVIVIGNITVGGTGKTPISIWLAQKLSEKGLQPAIVSRGYGGNVGNVPESVTATSDPAVVGDEPVLMANRSNCPVVVHRDRVRAAKAAVELGATVIIADDGLQHYRLQRDFEIALIDGTRGFGNEQMLPAGPLREPPARLEQVDRIFMQRAPGGSANRFGKRAGDLDTVDFTLQATRFRDLTDDVEVSLTDFLGQRVHAIAAIGNPQRFFQLLESYGIEIVAHPLRDHATIVESDLSFADDLPVVMTEKDAVKCRAFARDGLWYLPVEVEFAADVNMHWVDNLIQQICDRTMEIAG